MSDDQVKRYQLDYHHTQTYAEMVEDCDGDWVKYKDYKAASDRIEELEAELAKALDALKYALQGAEWSYYGINFEENYAEELATLAELKGEKHE